MSAFEIIVHIYISFSLRIVHALATESLAVSLGFLPSEMG
jgi:hypothetical protein